MKLFTTVINTISYQARMFFTISYFYPSLLLLLAGKAGANLSEDPYVTQL